MFMVFRGALNGLRKVIRRIPGLRTNTEPRPAKLEHLTVKGVPWRVSQKTEGSIPRPVIENYLKSQLGLRKKNEELQKAFNRGILQSDNFQTACNRLHQQDPKKKIAIYINAERTMLKKTKPKELIEIVEEIEEIAGLVSNNTVTQMKLLGEKMADRIGNHLLKEMRRRETLG